MSRRNELESWNYDCWMNENRREIEILVVKSSISNLGLESDLNSILDAKIIFECEL